MNKIYRETITEIDVGRRRLVVERSRSGRRGRAWEETPDQVWSLLPQDFPPGGGTWFAHGHSEAAISYVAGWHPWRAVRRAFFSALRDIRDIQDAALDGEDARLAMLADWERRVFR